MRVSLAGPEPAIAAVRAVLDDERDLIVVPAAEAADVALTCLSHVRRALLADAGLLADAASCRILVLGKLPTAYGMRVLMRHLDGIVLAAHVATTLVPTLYAVSAGQNVYPREFVGALSHPTLSTREKQVLGLVVLNASNAEIAQQLWVTESAVKNTLTSAFAKLGVRSRASAADLILDPDSGLGLGILRITPETDGSERLERVEAEPR
jgi:DNA-binding CsgD family transcriptional regulator